MRLVFAAFSAGFVLVSSLIELELEKVFQMVFLVLVANCALLRTTLRLCGAREMSLPRESLAVTLLPDAEKR